MPCCMFVAGPRGRSLLVVRRTEIGRGARLILDRVGEISAGVQSIEGVASHAVKSFDRSRGVDCYSLSLGSCARHLPENLVRVYFKSCRGRTGGDSEHIV